MNNRTKTLRADPKSLGFMFFLCWQICLVPRHHTSLVSCVSCLVASFWGASELSSLALFHQGTFGWNYLWWYCWSLFGLLRAQALSEIPSWAQWRPDVLPSLPTLRGPLGVLTSLYQLPGQAALSFWQQKSRQMGWATCVCGHSVSCQPDHCLNASSLVSWGHWSQLAASKLLCVVRLWTYT